MEELFFSGSPISKKECQQSGKIFIFAADILMYIYSLFEPLNRQLKLTAIF
jgi:hypothetical protein